MLSFTSSFAFSVCPSCFSQHKVGQCERYCQWVSREAFPGSRETGMSGLDPNWASRAPNVTYGLGKPKCTETDLEMSLHFPIYCRLTQFGTNRDILRRGRRSGRTGHTHLFLSPHTAQMSQRHKRGQSGTNLLLFTDRWVYIFYPAIRLTLCQSCPRLAPLSTLDEICLTRSEESWQC